MYNKFINQWEYNPSHKSISFSNKSNWISKFTNYGKIGNLELINITKERQKNLISSQKGFLLEVRNKSKFMTGLGYSHPIENGFLWHHTLGTPFLPGSSIKGVVKDWATNWKSEDQSLIVNIFGSTESTESEESKLGSIVFLDMIPVELTQLSGSVLTPHYSQYYSSESPVIPPADWFSPIPIPFLTVSEGNRFQLGIIPTRDEKNSCEKVVDWVKDSAKIIGFGAKTSVGYGRLEITNVLNFTNNKNAQV
ncbi:MAG: type III-B CRISPR module RAMP protein Cmr6 [Candidatus Hodarchaeales archaeon]